MLVIGNDRGPNRWSALAHGYLNLSCFLSMLPHLTNSNSCLGGPPHCSSPSPWLSLWFWLSLDGVDVGICETTCSCWASLDGGVGCGLIERDGGGCVFAITVMTISQSPLAHIVGFGLERKLAAWCLLCLMMSSSSMRFLCLSFLTLNFSHASSVPGPLLPNPWDVALLMLKVDFWRPLMAGMKSVELALNQLLSKMG